MKSNDDDIKIFHPAKKDSGGADLAELALLMDKYRGNGNMEKAAELGKALSELTPENFCPDEAKKLKSNELLQLRALMVFSAQISLHKYLPHAMLSSQAVNSMYAAISENSPGFFANIPTARLSPSTIFPSEKTEMLKKASVKTLPCFAKGTMTRVLFLSAGEFFPKLT